MKHLLRQFNYATWPILMVISTFGLNNNLIEFSNKKYDLIILLSYCENKLRNIQIKIIYFFAIEYIRQKYLTFPGKIEQLNP